MNTYQAGRKVRMSVAFTDVNGAPVDPAGTVTLNYQVGPNGAVISSVYPTNIIKDSVGNYHWDLDTTGLVGGVEFDWIGTGANGSVASGAFMVTALPV